MRYVAIARGAVDYSFNGEPSATADTVFESDRTPISTGLIDAQGTPLYRVPETVPLGFHGKPRIRVPARRR